MASLYGRSSSYLTEYVKNGHMVIFKIVEESRAGEFKVFSLITSDE
jgi:hypothetical protein